jgi:hypothetical protein
MVLTVMGGVGRQAKEEKEDEFLKVQEVLLTSFAYKHKEDSECTEIAAGAADIIVIPDDG